MKHEIKIHITATKDDEYHIDFTQELQGQYTPLELAQRIKYITEQIKELLIKATKESVQETINKAKYN